MSGPHSPCARGACAGRPVHLAGRHLDPRDELYDGPELLLKVLPLAVREQARRLVREAPALMPEVVDLAEYIEWQCRQVAAVRVDGDRREREAVARSGDCEHHGREIAELTAQLDRADAAHRAADAGRVALVGFLQVVRDFVDAHRRGTAPDGLTVTKVVDALAKAVKKAEAAHDRAWKR